MNIQNITALVGQLQSLGFENLGYSLAKRICFKPDNFILSKKVEEGKDRLIFELFFKKGGSGDEYVLMYYDATLQKEIDFPDTPINGVNVIALEKQLQEINWEAPFDVDIKKQWSPEDITSWEQEQRIESVVMDFASLELTQEGKVFATGLKNKYWAGIACQELTGSASPLKNKGEISQRFYFFDVQPGISIDEAYRFLQNRWLEKQLQIKRKQSDSSEISTEENDSSSFGSGLLKKKRFSRSKTVKQKNQRSSK